MIREIKWIETADIKKAVVTLFRKNYPPGKYRIYGKPEVDGYQVPSFFIDVRLQDRQDMTANIVQKEFRVYIVYFQQDPHSKEAEADHYQKIEEIAEMLISKSPRNKHQKMVVEVNGRFLLVSDFSSDYTGKENNILTVSFSLKFEDFKEAKTTEPMMEEFHLEQILNVESEE